MRRALRRPAAPVGGLAPLAVAYGFGAPPGRIDRRLSVARPGPYASSAGAREFLSGTPVVDLHADPLLGTVVGSHTGVDATSAGLLVDALRAEGFSQQELRRVLGGNALRVRRETLPK